MAGSGTPAAPAGLNASGARITIVHGRWHPEVAAGLLEGALRALEASGALVTVVAVSGAFELPVVAKAALEHGADAVVALGVIVRGDTPHFDYVATAATMGLTDVAAQAGKPVGFGVLTVDTEQQALDRAGLDGSREDKGREAAEAVVETLAALAAMREQPPPPPSNPTLQA